MSNCGHTYPSDAERDALTFRVMEVLAGIPVSTAMHILTVLAPKYIQDGMTVDLTHPRQQSLRAVLAVLAEPLPR